MFGNILKTLLNILQNIEPTLAKYAIVQNVVVVSVQTLKNNLAIWSHCFYFKLSPFLVGSDFARNARKQTESTDKLLPYYRLFQENEST